MSTAVAEAMLAGPLNSESLAQWLITAFKCEERAGYAGSLYRFSQKVEDGAEFLERINPHSDKSSAATRGWVTGLYQRPAIVLEMAELQAKLTHNTAGEIASVQAAVLLTQYLAYRCGQPTQAAKFVPDYAPWSVVPKPERASRFEWN